MESYLIDRGQPLVFTWPFVLEQGFVPWLIYTRGTYCQEVNVNINRDGYNSNS